MRVSGDAFHDLPDTGFSKCWLAGYICTKSLCLARIGSAHRGLDDKIGPQYFIVFAHVSLPSLLNSLPHSDYLILELQHGFQNELHPRPMQGAIGTAGLQAIFPLFVGLAQVAMNLGIVDDHSLRKDPHQDGHTQERPRDFDERKPFSVVACSGHLSTFTIVSLEPINAHLSLPFKIGFGVA